MIPIKNDQKRAVNQIQLWLRALAAGGLPIPAVIPDGIYDEKTGEAVRIFQSLSGITATGTVDYVTWLALRDGYRKAIEASEASSPIYPFEYILSDGVIGQGQQASLIYIVQAMIIELVNIYEGVSDQEVNGIFDVTTSNNIRSLQKTWLLPQTGEIDKETWNKLADAYNRNINRE